MEQLISISFGINILGGVCDVLTKKIPNWLTIPAMASGVILQFILGGSAAGISALLGLGTGFILLAPVWFMRYMGAGDVKLLMAIGAWTNPEHCFYVALTAVVIGGIYALFDVIGRGRLRIFMRSTVAFLTALVVPGYSSREVTFDKERKFTFGICMTLAQATIIYLTHLGKI